VHGLDKAVSADDKGSAGIDPQCIGHYAGKEHLLNKSDPPAIVPIGMPIPVRLVIGRDGGVKQVNVIRTSGQQRQAIENALLKWKFKPYEKDGRPAEVETGLSLQFTPAGAVKYSF